MASFSLEVIGLEEAMARMQNLSLVAEAGARQAVTGASNDALDASLPLIPVRTGFLKSQQHVNTGGFGGGSSLIWNELANNAPYARWVCFGHHTRSGSWVAPQDFMTGPREVGRRSLESRMGGILVGGD